MDQYIRQGDILFKKVDEDVQGKSLKSLTVAEGEFTGHHHVLVAEAGSQIYGDRTKFRVKGRARLTHPEHGPLEFGEGVYVVTTEREFDYVEKSLVQVRD